MKRQTSTALDLSFIEIKLAFPLQTLRSYHAYYSETETADLCKRWSHCYNRKVGNVENIQSPDRGEPV